MFVEVFVNNQKITVHKNSTILEACDKIGIEIPRFCFHRFLSVAGNCRMCLVEVDKVPKPLAACATPITNNMKILTETPFVKKARENVLEFLLQNHPLDCPVCDQGGECDLQDMTLNFGSDTSRFSNKKRGVENKKIGLIVKTIMTRCIHCTRCIRFATEVADVPTMGTSNRGQQTEIGFYVNKTFKSELSGNLVELCPVGALTSKKYAFSTRSWQIKKKNSIDLSDSIGSSVFYDLRGNEIVKVSPFTNDSINEEFISDKSRLLYIFGQNFKSFVSNFSQNKKVSLMLLLSRYGSKKLHSYGFYPHRFLYFVVSPIYLGLERLIPLKEYSYFFNYQIPSIQQNYQLNGCFNKNYKFNFSLLDVSKSDFCFLINANPRFDSNLLYNRLKRHFKSNLSGSLDGFGSSAGGSFYGVSPASFLNVAEGKHFICKRLKKSRAPLFIFGLNLIERFDNNFYWTFFNFLKKNLNLVQKDWFGFGLLNSAANFVGSNETGLFSMNQNTANLSSSFYFVGFEFFGNFSTLKLKSSKFISVFSEYLYENFYNFD
jgi:NADH-quinone oxidoreductase chain G